MSLRERLGRTDAIIADRTRDLYEFFGVSENPFPAAGQTSGHPRLETEADALIARGVEQFERDGSATQVLVIEGTQGVGKTNLLNYYQDQLQDLYSENRAYYIIRYYPDPESSFDSIIRRVFQEFGEEHLRALGQHLAALSDQEADTVVEIARGADVRLMLRGLRKCSPVVEMSAAPSIALEWLLGLRPLKKHRETLGVFFRLDTVEAKTQALRDIVVVSSQLGLFKGLFLLLDELEKQAGTLSKTMVLRYLFAIRALIDALPRGLFLMLAMTPDARARYVEMLPSLQGRLQTFVELLPLGTREQGIRLMQFYLEQAKVRAESHAAVRGWVKGDETVIGNEVVQGIWVRLAEESRRRGIRGVLQRDFLHALHEETEKRFAEAIPS